MINPSLKAREILEGLNISRGRAFALMRDDEIPTVFFYQYVRVRLEDLGKFSQANLADHKINLLKAKLAARTARVDNKHVNHPI